MTGNIFEELQEKKKHLVSLAKKAQGFGWIDQQRADEIINKLDNDTLTIGVIGQMKCGKSTFLNAFVFEDDVLPSATTPMTAALSVITYGEEKKIIAEFYTKDEWEEQKMQASRSLSDVEGNSLEESKVKAAKELVEKSSKLGSLLEGLLGKAQSDSFDNLVEYVGADGKYISITKSVTIYYPKEYLKGVEIVDTPGFNDPIVSREERTKAFLAKADVVLLMLYAGRPFDATDRDILFKNVRQCGTGKVLVGINKYDIPYENGETEDEIHNYVVEEIRKACRECNDNTLVEILKETSPIPLSAEMALLSELSMSKITGNEAYSYAWKRNCDNFEISNQHQMADKSHLVDLVNAVRKVIETEKEQILFAKPLNAIMAAAEIKKAAIEKELRECELLIDNLSQPDDELEERKEKLQKANRRLTKKINGLGDDIDREFHDIVQRGANELEDNVDAACKRMIAITEAKNRFKGVDSIAPKLDAELQKLSTRKLKRVVENLGNNAKTKLKNCVNDFLSVAGDILMRFVPELDSRDFVKSVERKIYFDIKDKDLFKMLEDDDQTKDSSLLETIGGLAYNFANGYTFGLLGIAVNVFSHGEQLKEIQKNINSFSAAFDPQPYLDTIFSTKDEILESVKASFIEDLLNPLEKQIEMIQADAHQKEEKKADAEKKREELKSALTTIITQIESVN